MVRSGFRLIFATSNDLCYIKPGDTMEGEYYGDKKHCRFHCELNYGLNSGLKQRYQVYELSKIVSQISRITFFHFFFNILKIKISPISPGFI